MKKTIFTLLVSLFSFCSCSAEEEVQNKDTSLTIDVEAMDFKQEAGNKDVKI